MGLIIVLLLISIALFILSTLIGVIAAGITYFINKQRRKRKAIFAFISPFVILFSWLFTAYLLSAIVCSSKNVDIGMGDYWQVPIADNYNLSFIDIPELGYLTHNKEIVISHISHIQTESNYIYGKSDDKYFLYNMNTKELKTADNDTIIEELTKLELPTAYNFYVDRRHELMGVLDGIILIVSLIPGVLILLFIRKILLKNKRD